MFERESGAERLYRGLLRLYPSEFRHRFGDEMVQLFADQLRDARAPRARFGSARTWIRTLGDLAVTAVSARTRGDRAVALSLAEPPSPMSKLLGVIGILGGLILIVAFVPSIPWTSDFFNLRLALFNAGAIAIVIAVHRRQSVSGRRVAIAGAVPAILANAWYLAMVIWVVAKPGEVGPGDYGPDFFAAGWFLWVADAWFGLVVLQLGVVSRLAGAALAVGSILTLSGMTGVLGSDLKPLFGPLALAGLAANGIAWIALGLEVALVQRRAVHQTSP